MIPVVPYEPDVALTDLALAVETGAFALIVARVPSTLHRPRRYTALFFLCLAASSLLGAVYHGWLPLGTATSAGRIVWILTMLSLGGAATMLWLMSGALMGQATRPLSGVALALFAGYAAIVLWVDDRFWVSIAFSLPPLVTLLGVFVWKLVRQHSTAAAFGTAAILLMFVASALQQLHVGLHPTYFNHNALYHVLQAVALALLFNAMRLLLRPVYSAADWQAELVAIFGRRGALPVCRHCGRGGFVGPRRARNDDRYRLCKFCGYCEPSGGPPVECQATVHGCAQWPRVAGAAYVWWVQPQETQYRCPYCGATVDVQRATVRRPADDPSHPWRAVPQGASFDQAAAFWVRHGRACVYL